jgi:hypothetical protein
LHTPAWRERICAEPEATRAPFPKLINQDNA